MATICILLPSHWGAFKGGAEFQAHSLADYLVRNTAHRVVYLTARAPSATNGYLYKVERIPSFLGRLRYRFGFFWDSFALYNALERIEPDVVIQRVASAYTGVAGFYCHRFRVPFIWHVSSDRDVEFNPEIATRGLAGAVDTALLRFGIKHANVIIAQTQAQAARLRSTYGRSATAVVPNFHPAPSGDCEKGSEFTVVWVANLKPLKQPDLFIRLARELVRYPEIKFKMIGRSGQDEWCDELLKSASTTPNLEYLGEIQMEEVNRLLDHAHVLVNTSLYEGLSNVFIQAWMRKVPVVSLNSDPDGVIERFHLGYLARTFESLRTRTLCLYEDRVLLKQIGVRAKLFAETHYSMSNAEVVRAMVEDTLNNVPK